MGEKRFAFFCGFRLFINRRVNRSHPTLRIQVFFPWLFVKSRDLSVLSDLPLRLMEKDGFGSPALGDEAHPREVSPGPSHAASQDEVKVSRADVLAAESVRR